METPSELRQIFGLPSMPKEVAESIGLEFDEFIEDVALPVRPKSRTMLKREMMGKDTPYKARGKSFACEENNPANQRWKCLQCGLESNPSGISKHQRVQGHTGKQRVFAQLESLGIV